MASVRPQDTPENLEHMCHSVVQVSCQLLNVILNVLSSNFRWCGATQDELPISARIGSSPR